MYLILVGGGHVGVNLAKKLHGIGHEVLLVEKDAKTAQKLSTMLGEEVVYLGDGCEILVQKECGFNRADVVVAVTGEDEDNLVVCQMAKTLWGVKRVLSRINDPSHEDIFRKIGIDDTVSATSIIFSLLEQQITTDEMVPVGTLGKGNMEVVEALLSHRSPVLGKRVRDLALPGDTHFAWLIRKERGQAVTGDTELQEGDTIVALVPRDQTDALKALVLPPKVQQ